MRIESLLQPHSTVSAGRVALRDQQRTITYGLLPSVVRSEAQFLAANGGWRFSVLAENGCPWAVADLALHHLGRVNVPLPTFFTEQQRLHSLDQAGIDTLVTDSDACAEALNGEFRVMAKSPVTGLLLLRRALEPERVAQLPEGTAKVTYTSGSTADPKGVCLTARAMDRVSHSIASATASLGIMRHLCLLPLPTLLENLAGIHAPLRSGITCTVLPATVTGISFGAVDAQRLISVVDAERPESLILVPELLKLLVRAAQSGRWRPRGLRFIAVGGASVSRALLEEAADLALPVFEGYGLSECASVVCLNTPAASRAGSVGRALPHARIRRTSSGELVASGATMSGYLADRASWYPNEIPTGDLGEIDEDGFVYLHGRVRNVFISSFGRNVSPEWVERELTHESVIRYAVVCGEAQPFAVALVSPLHGDPHGRATGEAVRRANSRLPDYARVQQWAFLPETPSLENGLLTANGRLRRERVLERFGGLMQELASGARAAEVSS